MRADGNLDGFFARLHDSNARHSGLIAPRFRDGARLFVRGLNTGQRRSGAADHLTAAMEDGHKRALLIVDGGYQFAVSLVCTCA
jgi:hypothetical protein